ncbi:MAG: acetate--CoA ligase family protein, partial [Anaerolineales bacterium]|nr:acetate--CoA ligase family protein [Anaerolineales bacterium]
FQCAHIPTYPFPERAASALGALVRRTETLDRRSQTIERAAQGRNPTLASPNTTSAVELISSYGISTALIKFARDKDEAADIANKIGFPLVMKIASPDIVHKSDAGGVLLNINDIPTLHSSYAQMMKRVKALIPPPRIEGVYLQRQIADGQEVIIGMVRDPLFGVLMMFGAGGIEVEGLKDVTFALAPLNQAGAREMIRKTWAGKKLRGFRSIPPVDEKSVIDALIKLSRLAMDHENIEEIEINPLRVLSKGAVAVDVRVKLRA